MPKLEYINTGHYTGSSVNPVCSYPTLFCGNRSCVSFTKAEWNKMTKKEKMHAKNAAGCNFNSLVRIITTMNKHNCSYKEAVRINYAI